MTHWFWAQMYDGGKTGGGRAEEGRRDGGERIFINYQNRNSSTFLKQNHSASPSYKVLKNSCAYSVGGFPCSRFSAPFRAAPALGRCCARCHVSWERTWNVLTVPSLTTVLTSLPPPRTFHIMRHPPATPATSASASQTLPPSPPLVRKQKDKWGLGGTHLSPTAALSEWHNEKHHWAHGFLFC